MKLKRLSIIAIILTGFVFSSQLPENSTREINLFNGVNLDGWTIHGTEKWVVESGELVCESGPDHEYGYLSTKKMYKDFDLSLLFKQESDGNSGVFFRSTFEGTKVSGWQVEVAPKGHDTGGIYESYGRGWLEQIPDQKEMVLAQGSWNKLRVKVIGDHVQTWLNGIKMVNMFDKKIGKGVGSIALQIHSGDNVRVRWRDIHLTEFIDIFSSVKEFPKMVPNEKIQLLSSLAQYANNPKVDKIIKSSLKSKHGNVRIAALSAAKNIVDPKIVKILAEHAANSEGKEKETAQNSLYKLNGAKINSSILSGLSNRNNDIKVELIRAIKKRQINDAIKPILRLASHKNENVRVEAVKALTVIASRPYIKECIQLLIDSQNDEERNELEKTITGLLVSSSYKADGNLLVNALNKAKTNEAKLSLIRILGEFKDSDTLPTLTALLKDLSSEIQQTTIIALSDWPNDQPLSPIMKIIGSAKDSNQKALAIEASIKLIGVNKSRNIEASLRLYDTVLSSCNNDDETKALLKGLESGQSIEAFKMAQQFLKDGSLGLNAESACISIAKNIQSFYPEECSLVLNNIIQKSSSSNHQRIAQSVLNKIQRLEDYITEWMMSEPFATDGQSLYSTQFDPEKDWDAYPLWRKVPAFSDKNNYWHVDLAGLKTSLVAVVYLKTKVWSNIDQTVRLEMGSNDGIKAWMNDDLVHLHSVGRGVSPGDDVVEAQLNKGWNTLLLKIINEGGGGWGACARLRAQNGGHLSNIKFER